MARQSKYKVKFNPKRIVRMYKAGKSVNEIALAIGYPENTGQNRTRNVLIKEGLYAVHTRQRKAAPAPRRKRPQPTPQADTSKLFVSVPATPDTALKVCLKTIDVEANKLAMDDVARGRFARMLMGMIATNFGVHDFVARKPVLVLNEKQAMPHVMQAANA